jgi:hypothetical protein
VVGRVGRGGGGGEDRTRLDKRRGVSPGAAKMVGNPRRRGGVRRILPGRSRGAVGGERGPMGGPEPLPRRKRAPRAKRPVARRDLIARLLGGGWAGGG